MNLETCRSVAACQSNATLIRVNAAVNADILAHMSSGQPSTVAHFGLLELAQATADEMAARTSGDGETLFSLLASGLLSELSYMSADEQAECLERAAFLSTCEPDEISDAADFLALVITAGR